MKTIPNAHTRGLDREEWYAAFLEVAEERTGLDEFDFNESDVLDAYYSPTTTPYEGVSQDMAAYGLVDITE